ncbi:hypothetical protein HJC23_013803 [Cyclotella cryptica]|uniref:Uncharacterized protein n=1 Tax=Cyclotella cryptica TaxID=29204 RepID=A0ABD3PG47_9STRA
MLIPCQLHQSMFLRCHLLTSEMYASLKSCMLSMHRGLPFCTAIYFGKSIATIRLPTLLTL